MSAAGRSTENASDASDVARQLREAAFVRLVGAPTGDSLAASGVLARALDARDRPFQVSIADLPTDADRATEADLTVAVGRGDPTVDLTLPGGDRPVSETAFAVARELSEPESLDDETATTALDTEAVALAGAGVVADGDVPTGPLAEATRAAAIQRRPGVAVPTTDIADGLAHSTLIYAPFSGEPEAAGAAIDSLDLPVANGGVESTALDADDRRRVASLVALNVVGSDEVPARGSEAVERVLRPFAGGPFETIGGYADVLDAVARERPGTGVALALGHDVTTAALDAWRSHALRAHAAVGDATTGRYDGLYVARTDSADAPVETVARLVHAYRSPEPLTLVVTDGAAAAVASAGADLSTPTGAAADATDGTAEVTGSTARARFEADTATFITAFREAQ